MSLTTIAKLSSYIYFISAILIPNEMINLTAQFMSIITTLPAADSSSIITHVSKSFVVLIKFIVLFTILGVNAIYNLFKKGDRETISVYKKKTNNIINKKINNTPAMQSTAAVTLKSTTQKNTEPMTAPLTFNGNLNISSIKIEPTKLIVTKEPTTTISQQLNKTTVIENSQSVVDTTLAQDQLIKQEKNTSTLIEHVTPLPLAEQLIVRPEESIPSLKSDDDGDEEDSNSIRSIKQSSDVSKEQYYSNLIKKDNNLMSLSDNLQRIFDKPSTPVPLNQSLISDSIISNDTGHYENNNNNNNERPGSIQTSIEETALATTPALTPPNPSSTVSRKSSIASQKSILKGMFNSTFQKMARKDSINSQNEPPPQLQPQQQQTIMPDFHDLTASTSTKRLSRLSTFRLGRKKSTASNTSKHVKQVLPDDAPVIPTKEKSSFKSSMKNKLKKLVKKS